jgi:hypothetical protein
MDKQRKSAAELAGMVTKMIGIGAPCVDFVGEDLLVGDAAIQTLRREHAEFGFGHVEPTAVLGRVMPLCAAENYGGRSNDLTT